MSEDEIRKRIKSICERENVEMSDEAKDYFDRAGHISATEPGGFDVVKAKVISFWGPYQEMDAGNQGGMCIAWQTRSAGFGSLTLCIDNDGKLHVDNEGMSQQFCLEVLAKLLASAIDDHKQAWADSK